MASYTVINTAQWAPPETSRYDGIDYRREDEEYSSSYSGPQYIRRNSVSVHRQPPSHDYYNDERGVEYTREARYGSSYRSNDPSAFLPELSTSPSISSGSSIKTPSIRSYQTTSGSYFPPAIKGREIRYEETRLKYPPQYGNIDNEVRDAGSLFSNLKIEDSYSARMDSGLYDNSDPTYPSRDYARREGDESVRYDVDDRFDEAEPTIPSRSRRHSIISSKSQIKQQSRQDWLPTPSTEKTEDEIRFEVDDVFDEAEDTVTADGKLRFTIRHSTYYQAALISSSC